MITSRSFAIACLVGLMLAGTSFAETRERASVLAFEFSYADPELAKLGKHPYFRVFPDGKDKKGSDASGTLGTLKSARGESKLYTKEDREPGLIVVLRRVVFVPQASGDYRALLEGEYNAVQTVIAKETIAKLLAGETTELVFASEATKGVRPLAFTIKATTTMRAALRDGQLHIFGGEGASTITHYALLGNYVYESDPVPLAPADNRDPVYIGRAAKVKLKAGGQPETLPIIN